MYVTREPHPRLRPFVKRLWAAAEPKLPGADGTTRERVLPTGDMHVVFRFGDRPLRLLRDLEDPTGTIMDRAIVGGSRASCYLRDMASPSWSVGALLHASAARVLFGAPAGELAERHTLLADLWGGSAELAREQLFAAGGPDRQLDVLEALLSARLPAVRSLHPAVAEALARFRTVHDVGAAVKATGYSHRRFIGLFTEDMGLPPKRFCRVLRFQHVIDRLLPDSRLSLADVALDTGYSDQSHMHRDFRELAGITPGEYRELAPASSHHVPAARSLPPPFRGSISSKTG